MNSPAIRPPARRSVGIALAALAAAGAFAATGLSAPSSAAAESAVKIPPPAGAATTSKAADTSGAQQTAVFAGGCFWGVQGVFQHTKGVLDAVAGYASGSQKTAHYEIVGSGLTGHAEAVQVTYDPRQVSYAQLLQIFFSVAHDPTQLNMQFPDRGTQYRSAIFTTSEQQKDAAMRYVAQLDAAKVFPAKIVTQIEPLPGFYAAEDYHQDYLALHPESGYIATYDLPKLTNLKNLFTDQYRDEPVLVAGRPAAASKR